MKPILLPLKRSSEFQPRGRARYAIAIEVNEDTARALLLMNRRGGPRAKVMLTHYARVLAELAEGGCSYRAVVRHLLKDIDKVPRDHAPLSPAAVEAADLADYIGACRRRRLSPDLSSVRGARLWDLVATRLEQAGLPKAEIQAYAKTCPAGRAWLRIY